MSNRYSLFPASFVHAGGTLNLVQLGEARAAANSNIDEIIPGGAVDRAANIMSTAIPMANLVTADLVTALGATSVAAGLNCTGNSTFRYQRRAEQGIWAGGATNITLVAAKGFLFPASLQAANSGMAMLALSFCPLYDGTNIPLIPTNSVDFTAAPAPAFTSAFYHSTTYVNGVLMDGNTAASIDFGLVFDPLLVDGSVFPSKGSIVVRRPTISLTFKKADMISANMGNFFHAALAGTIAVYFRKGSPGSDRVAVATTQHVKISATAGTWGPDDVAVSGQDDTSVTITVRPTSALASSVASAIP